MKNATIIHGKPSKEEYYNPAEPSCSNYHWVPWLQKQLLVKDIDAQTPEIANAWRPNYAKWSHEFERYDLTPETLLVGHSCGGGFLVRWLSEHKDVYVGRVLLVAPWMDPDREDTTDFFEFTIDPELTKRTSKFIIFNSDNDHKSIHKTVKLIQDAIPGTIYQEFHQFGHFTINSMPKPELPEAITALLS